MPSPFKRHFFVCQTKRPPFGKPSCGQSGGDQIFAALQDALQAHPELWNDVTVTSTLCMGPCFDGPTVVCYPEGTWYGHVKEEDVPEIVESHLVGGKPVERLIYKWPGRT